MVNEELRFMACCVPQKCSKKLITLIRIITLSAAVIPAAICVLTIIFIDLSSAVLPMAAVLVLIWTGIRFAPMYYESLSYTRARSFFRIEHGVFWHRRILIPNNKIQYVDIRRNPLERITGISTLIFFTPGGKIPLHGIDVDNAKRLVRLLSEKTRKGDL